MAFEIENAEAFLAPYLTRDRKAGFLDALKAFPNVRPLYARLDDPEPLQGDAWSGVPIIDLERGVRRSIRAILLSNSCDISTENQRSLPVKLSFAPIIDLANYRNLLEREGVAREKIDNHIGDVIAQRVSSLFFLPAGSGLVTDSIAVLDDIHTVRLEYFNQQDGRGRIFALSDLGFWLFLFKLSFHFCRLHEGIDRTPAGT